MRFALLWVAGASALYAAALHPWLMRWGATPAEELAPLAGDELAAGPYYTHALSIAAPPRAVWPWLVQMGQDRAGFYSNQWLENLFTVDVHNAERLHPEWQRLSVGARVPLARPGLRALGKSLGNLGEVKIVALVPEHMVAYLPGRFVLLAAEGGGTRLLFRETLASQGPALFRWLVWDGAHFVMVQRMLRGIKERAEGQPLVPRWLLAVAKLGWLAAGVGLLWALGSRRALWGLGLSAALVLPVLLTTADFDAALAGFLLVGGTYVGVRSLGGKCWPLFLSAATFLCLVLLVPPYAYTALGLLLLALPLLLAVSPGARAQLLGTRTRKSSPSGRSAGALSERVAAYGGRRTQRLGEA